MVRPHLVLFGVDPEFGRLQVPQLVGQLILDELIGNGSLTHHHSLFHFAPNSARTPPQVVYDPH